MRGDSSFDISSGVENSDMVAEGRDRGEGCDHGYDRDSGGGCTAHVYEYEYERRSEGR